MSRLNCSAYLIETFAGCLNYCCDFYLQLLRSVSSDRHLHGVLLPEVEIAADIPSSVISSISGMSFCDNGKV